MNTVLGNAAVLDGVIEPKEPARNADQYLPPPLSTSDTVEQNSAHTNAVIFQELELKGSNALGNPIQTGAVEFQDFLILLNSMKN